ncbi:hypothetical protein BC831DRAFT_423805 [Entophlyctis helioformis]|nr:hypothetical protein BC831DRAFT_423805 [Entophlyctis helioformis]
MTMGEQQFTQHNFELSTGVLRTVYEGEGNDSSPPQLVVQVLTIKKIPNPPQTAGAAPPPDRYRLLISDGVSHSQAMLTTQLNEHIVSNAITKNSILRITKYICNSISVKRVLIILALENLIPYDTNIARIGNPVSIEASEGSNPAVHAQGSGQAAPMRQQQQQPTAQMQPQMQPQPQQHQQQQQMNMQQQQPMQQQPMQNAPYGRPMGGAASSMPGDVMGATVFAIKSLNPYQNKWTIKARVINKSQVRTWNKGGREGRLFSVTFADESGDIRATGFNDAVNAFYDILEEGKVFYVSKAAIKAANKQFNTTSNDYEMTIEVSTTIVPCVDETQFPTIRYNTVSLDKLLEVEKDTNVDIIGVVKECNPCATIVTKAAKELKKRDLLLVDESGWSVRLTLWGRQAETFEHHDNPIIAIKGARVGDWGGRTLSCQMSSTVELNPQIEESYKLRAWYDSVGASMNFHAYSSTGGGGGGAAGGKSRAVKTIAQVKAENLGMGSESDFYTIRAWVSFVRNENIWYPACPNDACKGKKVVEVGSDWRCERCNSSYPTPNYRYILSFSVSDYTGQTWLSTFNEVGEKLLGKSANEMVVLKENNRAEFDRVLEQAVFRQYTFNCRAKAETYQDELKVRTTCLEANPVDLAAGSRDMIAMISSALGRTGI